MIIQIVKFETTLTEDEVLAVAQERVEQFRALPGLLQKYNIKLPEPNRYGGVYIWDSKASMEAYLQSDLRSSIAEKYKVIDGPRVEVIETLFQLRD